MNKTKTRIINRPAPTFLAGAETFPGVTEHWPTELFRTTMGCKSL